MTPCEHTALEVRTTVIKPPNCLPFKQEFTQCVSCEYNFADNEQRALNRSRYYYAIEKYRELYPEEVLPISTPTGLYY